MVFDVLSNERRRRTLAKLCVEPETTLRDLAEHLASIENNKPTSALSSSERKRVYIALYQCHLPKLDDADIITFDYDRKTIERGSNFGQVTGYFPGAVPRESDTNERFVSLTRSVRLLLSWVSARGPP